LRIVVVERGQRRRDLQPDTVRCRDGRRPTRELGMSGQTGSVALGVDEQRGQRGVRRNLGAEPAAATQLGAHGSHGDAKCNRLHLGPGVRKDDLELVIYGESGSCIRPAQVERARLATYRWCVARLDVGDVATRVDVQRECIRAAVEMWIEPQRCVRRSYAQRRASVDGREHFEWRGVRTAAGEKK
jgi:hypothetical protein